MKKPIVKEAYTDNGAFSHWVLIDGETGIKLWSEDPGECKAMGYPVRKLPEYNEDNPKSGLPGFQQPQEVHCKCASGIDTTDVYRHKSGKFYHTICNKPITP